MRKQKKEVLLPNRKKIRLVWSADGNRVEKIELHGIDYNNYKTFGRIWIKLFKMLALIGLVLSLAWYLIPILIKIEKLYWGVIFITISVLLFLIKILKDVDYSVYIKKIFRENYHKEKENSLGSISEKIFYRITKKYSLIAYSVIWGFVIYSILSLVNIIHFNNYIMYGFLIFLLVCISEIFFMKYRIIKGYYGNNEFEAIEIIKFIVEETKQGNFPKSGEKLLPDEQLHERLKNILNPSILKGMANG